MLGNKKILHLLALKDLEDLIEDDPPADGRRSPNLGQARQERSSRIGLSLSDQLLENVRDFSLAKQM